MFVIREISGIENVLYVSALGGGGAAAGEEKLPAPFAGTGSCDFIELFCGSENQAMRWFASYRSAAPNAGSEPKRKGSVKLPETRKLHGTQ